MSRRRYAPLSRSALAGLRSYVVRLALVVAILGLPILGTSYYFVSQVSADIGIATLEHESLLAFGAVADIFPLIEALHRAVRSDGTGSGRARRGSDRARSDVDAAVAKVGRTYAHRPLLPVTRNEWNAWRAHWTQARRAPTYARLDALLDGLRDLGGDLEYDSPLDYDPSYAIQNLAALILRQEPRSLAAMRQTIDAVHAIPRERLDFASVAALATGSALQVQPLALATNDVSIAISLEPRLVADLTPLSLASGRATDAYRARIASILKRARRSSGDDAAAERAARAALDAHERVWRVGRAQADALILQRLDAQLVRRRLMSALSVVAVLLGTLGMALIGRWMARRDRADLASSQLEADKLRAELAQVTMERALRLREAQFKTVFENTDLGIVIFDDKGAVVQFNPAVERILGSSARALLHEQRSAIAEFSRPDRASFSVDSYFEGDDGKPKWLALTFSGEYYEGVCQTVTLLLRDATEERTLHQRLAYEATHDALTHIANRAAFEPALAAEFAPGRAGEAFALMYVDLDRFKSINDTHGHAAGDRVLMTTAERLVAAVSTEDLCARLGGDEFAVLLRGTNDPEAIASIALRVNAKLAAPIAYGELRLAVTASIGIAIGSPDYATAEELKQDADLALYAVKERGRDGMHVYARHAGEPDSAAGATASRRPA